MDGGCLGIRRAWRDPKPSNPPPLGTNVLCKFLVDWSDGQIICRTPGGIDITKILLEMRCRHRALLIILKTAVECEKTAFRIMIPAEKLRGKIEFQISLSPFFKGGNSNHTKIIAPHNIIPGVLRERHIWDGLISRGLASRTRGNLLQKTIWRMVQKASQAW